MKIVYVLILILVCFGCNLFEPREAEPPDPPADWHVFPTTHVMCLENLIFAHNYRENMWNYGNILSEQFEFIFDRQDVSDFTLPNTWNRISETVMLRNAHSQAGASGINLELSLIENQVDDVRSNMAWIFRNYSLKVDSFHDDNYQIFSGRMELYLEIEHGLWVIREWFDFRDGNIWTWGRMKNAFSV